MSPDIETNTAKGTSLSSEEFQNKEGIIIIIIILIRVFRGVGGYASGQLDIIILLEGEQ